MNHADMCTITINGEAIYSPIGRRLDDVLSELRTEMTLPDPRPCGGFGMCGCCRVMIRAESGAVNHPTEDERIHLSDDELSRGIRLACRTVIWGNCAITTRDHMTE